MCRGRSAGWGVAADAWGSGREEAPRRARGIVKGSARLITAESTRSLDVKSFFDICSKSPDHAWQRTRDAVRHGSNELDPSPARSLHIRAHPGRRGHRQLIDYGESSDAPPERSCRFQRRVRGAPAVDSTSRTRSTCRVIPSFLKMWRTCVRMVFTRRPVAEAISPTVLPSAGNAATRLSIGVRPRIAASTPGSIRCRDPGGRHAEVLVRHPCGRAATLLRRSTSGVSLPGTRPAPTSVCVQSQSPSASLLSASASSGSPSPRRTDRSTRSTRRPRSASPAARGEKGLRVRPGGGAPANARRGHSRNLAPGSWLLAPGSWLLAPGSWLLICVSTESAVVKGLVLGKSGMEGCLRRT